VTQGRAKQWRVVVTEASTYVLQGDAKEIASLTAT
jgi:hypothetical protein